MSDYQRRMRDGMALLHVNDDDRMTLEELYSSKLAGRKKEQILSELKEWSGDETFLNEDE